MGRVAITYKVYAENPEVQEAVKQKILAEIKPTQLIEIPIFGGLNAYKVIVIRDDKQGGGDTEEKLRNIPGVSEVQEDDVSLIS